MVIEKQKKPVSFGKGGGKGAFENVNARGCLVSGPPGIGKSTAVRIVVKACGYHCVEYNASDSRGKNIVEELAGGIAKNRVLVDGVLKKPCLIMEEVDGMGAGDRGGAGALSKLIKEATVPVICLCNDRMDPKMRTLANHCYDIKFQRPPKTAIAQRVGAILAAEGHGCDPSAIERVAESVGSDVRQVLNQLQLMFKQGAKNLSYSEVADKLGNGAKDEQVMLGPFDVCKDFFNGQLLRRPIRDQFDACFVDADLLPLLMQENYLRAAESNKSLTMRQVHGAADSLVWADIMQGSVMRNQAWSLMPSCAMNSIIAPAYYVKGGFLSFPQFPSWLGKNSTANKAKRLVAELQSNLWRSSTARSKHMRQGYTEALYSRAVSKLSCQNPDIAEAVEELAAYGLTKEHLVDHLTALRLPTQQDEFKEVAPATKAAFTRQFGKVAGPSRTVTQSTRGVKKEALSKLTEDDDEDHAEDGSGDEKDEKEVPKGAVAIPGVKRKAPKAKSTAKKQKPDTKKA